MITSELVNNVKQHDLHYMDYLISKNKLSLNDLERIWKDIKEHERISMEMVRGNKSAEAKCSVEWDELKKEFNKRLNGYKFYTDWEGYEIGRQMAGGGVEVPADISGEVKEKGYSFSHIDIEAECPKISDDEKINLELCKTEVEHTLGCETEAVSHVNGNTEEIYMRCEVFRTGRKVPVVFHLKV